MQRGYQQNPYLDPQAGTGTGQNASPAANMGNPYTAGTNQNPYANQNPYGNQNPYAGQNPYMSQSGAYAQGQSGSWNVQQNGNPYASPYAAGAVQQQAGGFQTGGYAQQMSQTYGSQGYVMPQHSASYSAPVPQANLYTGPVPVVTSSTAVPTPQMTREGLKVQPREPFSLGRFVKRYWMVGLALLIVALAVVLFIVLSPGQSRYDAKNVVEALYLRNMPIVEAYDFTEETDPDRLLNQPGMYTSKAGWMDSSLTGGETVLDRGGFIEVFDSTGAAENRLQQLRAMNDRDSGRCFKVKRAVMRLSIDMPISLASQYENALLKMFGQ